MRLAPYFNNDMVLQRNKNVPVWDQAPDGEAVTVSFANQTKNAVAADGKWKVELEPLPAGGPYALIVTCAADTITYTNILMGDVWLGTGQSNAGVNIGYYPTLYAQESSANFPEIRHMYNPPFTSSTPLDSLDIEGNFTWYTADNPININLLSAMSYLFSKELYLETGVPIGVVYCWNAGTMVEQWMSPNAIIEAIGEELYQQYPLFYGNNWPPGEYFNAMLYPISHMAFTGATWYQGESNGIAPNLYDNYDRTLAAMIGEWRSVLSNGDFPFLIVGLPTFTGGYPPDSWAILREKQIIVDRTVQNTALTVHLDNTDIFDLHPDNKPDVGHRLANAALVKVHGQNILYTGPRYRSVIFENGEAIITFKGIGANLTATGVQILGFRIGTSKADLVQASAEFLGTDQVRVWSGQVTSPAVVYYGWENCPVANLCDEVGNPAAPFRTNMPETPILDGSDPDYQPGDLDNDGIIGSGDLNLMARDWLQSGSLADIFPPPPDGDDIVNLLARLLPFYKGCKGP